MENKKKESKKWDIISLFGKYGTYALVIVCIIGVAVASILILPNEQKKQAAKSDTTDGDTARDTADGEKPVTGMGDESINDMLNPATGTVTDKDDHNVSAIKNTPTPDFTPTPTEQPKQQALLSPPVSGEIIWGYAVNELIYSATLDQWTTHAGVDVACKQGDKIHSVDDGIVEKVYDDDAFGTTVVIKHKNNRTSVYSNLAKSSELVKEGASVKANDVIGICGNTAKFECEDKSHLHFEFLIDSKPVNPEKYVRFKNIDN